MTLEGGGAVYTADMNWESPSPLRIQATSSDAAAADEKREMEELRKYNRFVKSRIRYYEELLSSKLIKRGDMGKATQILHLYHTLKSGSLHPKIQDPEGISKDSIYVKGTTLLEPVPFLGIDKNEEHEINAEIAEIDRIKDKVNDLENPYGDDYYEGDINFLKLTGVDSGEHSYRPGPVLQLISVTISNKCDGTLTNGFEVSGEILVTDERNNTFTFYKCDHSDYVSPRHNLLHVYGCPIAPIMGRKVKLNLTNTDANCKIFDDEYDLNDSIVHEEKTTLICVGIDQYWASIEFHQIQFGIIASVRMNLGYKPPLNGKRTCNVHGSMKVNDILCFKKDASDPYEILEGEANMFSQFRSIFALPIMANFNVKVELFSGDLEVVVGTLKLPATRLSQSHDTYSFPCCKHESYSFFRIIVDWFGHDDFFERSYWEEENANWECVDQMYQQPVATVESSNHSPLVEIFSILVCGGDSSAPPALCGSVIVRDGDKTVYIFSRNKNRPDKLSNKKCHGRSLSLAWPDRWLLEDDFYMHLKLKDSHGIRVCRGSFRWYSTIKRYEVRLCDFIPGDNGFYAEVHYSVFKNGKKAKVSMNWDGDYDVIVYGSVLAEYVNYDDDYPTPYDKKYYQIVIFKRSKEDGMRVNHSSKIPLSKSYVSAPSDCQGLRVHVKLYHPAILGSRKSIKTIGTRVFEANANAIGDLGFISVKVEWEE